MSLMKILNSRDLKIELCGTPLFHLSRSFTSTILSSFLTVLGNLIYLAPGPRQSYLLCTCPQQSYLPRTLAILYSLRTFLDNLILVSDVHEFVEISEQGA